MTPQVYFDQGEHSGIMHDDMMRAMQPSTFETETCGEWEPPEGRVCGNCKFFVDNPQTHGDEWGTCLISCLPSHVTDDRGPFVGTASDRHESDGCLAWRWRGEDE